MKRSIFVAAMLPVSLAIAGVPKAECQEAKGWKERVVYFRVKGHAKPFACHLEEVAPLMERVYRRIYGEVEVVRGYEGPLEAPPTLKGRTRMALVREVNEVARKMEELRRAFERGRMPFGKYMREYQRLWSLYWQKVLRLWAAN